MADEVQGLRRAGLVSQVHLRESRGVRRKGSPWPKHDCTPVDRDEVRRLLSLRDARGRVQACNGTWSVEVRVVDMEVRKDGGGTRSPARAGSPRLRYGLTPIDRP